VSAGYNPVTSTGAFICYYTERHAEQEVLSRGRHWPELSAADIYRCKLTTLLFY